MQAIVYRLRPGHSAGIIASVGVYRVRKLLTLASLTAWVEFHLGGAHQWPSRL